MHTSTQQLSADSILHDIPAGELAESPLWHPTEQALYWVDISLSKLHRLDPSKERHDEWILPEQPGCLAWGRMGEIIIASARTVYATRPVAGSPLSVLRTLAHVPHTEPDMRVNDGRCDRQGRLWFSTMKSNGQKDRVGKWYRLDRHGLFESALTGFTTPNGSAFSPNGDRMYLAESAADVRTVWAIDYDAQTGALGDRRSFADFHHYIGRPDGACVDESGCYWVAATQVGRLLRFTPQGALDQMIELPFNSPTMPCFGGPDLKTLYVASLRRNTEKAADDPFAGCMLAFRVTTAGLPEAALDA
jgi:sugar lactone lactonase YvrE